MILPLPANPLAARFAGVINGLGHALAAWHPRDRSAMPLISLIYGHLLGLRGQFTKLAERFAAGTLRPRRRHMAKRAAGRVAAPRTPRLLPRGFAWLGKLAPGSGGHGLHLHELALNDPEIAALVAASPQAARILRSVLWMTGVRPVPAILRRPRVARAPRARPGRPVVPILSANLPLPPGVRRHPYRPSAKWPKGVTTWPVQRRDKPRSTAGPPRKA